MQAQHGKGLNAIGLTAIYWNVDTMKYWWIICEVCFIISVLGKNTYDI